MFIFFDTETTGLPANFKAPASDIKNWPRIVSFSWILYDTAGKAFREADFIVYPEQWEISKESEAIHGISNETAEREGIPLEFILSQFRKDAKECRYGIAHNMAFDSKVITAEHIRNGKACPLRELKLICTMERTVNLCRLPSKGRSGSFKWPKLQELHLHLFGKEFGNAHNSLADVRATADCFFKLREKEVLEL
jgi:DNA polymerase III epsilon subunit-like protein